MRGPGGRPGGRPSGIHDTAPAAAWPDAFLAGNGRHGALVYGAPHDETVIITHHSLVVPDGSAKRVPPLLAGRLEETRDLLLAGQSAAALELFGAGWPEHALQPFHPAFAIRLQLGGHGPVSGYRRAVDFAAGVVAAQ